MPSVRSDLSELTWTPEVPEHIAALEPYAPGKPIEETKREFGIQDVVKLASNENPLGPSRKALAAVKGLLPELHLYPDASHYHLKKALSRHLDCGFDELSIGNGSNEFIDLLPRIFAPKDRNVVSHEKAFIIYKLCAQLQGCGYVEAKVDRETFKPSVDRLLKTVNSKTRLVMLANPNNPTGTYLDADEVKHLARELYRRQILLVLDYAYWEYVTEKAIPDPMKVFRRHPNVIVLRTFSKIYGLAGTRVGYLIGHSDLVGLVERGRQPFNVSSTGLVAAVAALDDETHVERSVKLNATSKAALLKGLAKFPVTVLQGQGNFLLVDMHRASRELYPEFLRRGVIIRPLTNYGLPTHFRVTAGLPFENQKFLTAMTEIFGKRGGGGR